MKTDQERMQSKQFRELRKENIRLRRQLKEMKKELRFAEENQNSDDDEFLVCDEKKEVYPCPKCQSEQTVVFQIVARLYYKCESCGSKGRKAN